VGWIWNAYLIFAILSVTTSFILATYRLPDKQTRLFQVMMTCDTTVNNPVTWQLVKPVRQGPC
jgi:hypothetical protein